MARTALEIIWSPLALDQRAAILDYWTSRLGTTSFSEKLAREITLRLETVAKYPGIGKPVRGGMARIVHVRRYALVYRVEADVVRVVTLWDTRRDPARRPY